VEIYRSLKYKGLNPHRHEAEDGCLIKAALIMSMESRIDADGSPALLTYMMEAAL
jgi:hypothetical protein